MHDLKRDSPIFTGGEVFAAWREAVLFGEALPRCGIKILQEVSKSSDPVIEAQEHGIQDTCCPIL
jgi:hypothetical protein